MKFLPLILLLLFCTNLYAAHDNSKINPFGLVPEAFHERNNVPPAVDDKKLFRLAAVRGIIPREVPKGYVSEQIELGNTIHIWLVLSRENKIQLIDILKDLFLEKDDITIRAPSGYYVDVLNEGLYGQIKNGTFDPDRKGGIKEMFTMTAIMAGDWGNGMSRVDTLKEYFGEQSDGFIMKYPGIYKRLVEMDEEFDN